jgi:hypothetical protein
MKFVIEYRCALSRDASPVFQTTVTAPSKAAAQERFYDTDDQDWEVLSIRREASALRDYIPLPFWDDGPGMMRLWGEMRQGPVKLARRLFPERHSGYVRDTENLVNLGVNRSCELSCAARGEKRGAEVYREAQIICAARISNECRAFLQAKGWDFPT